MTLISGIVYLYYNIIIICKIQTIYNVNCKEKLDKTRNCRKTFLNTPLVRIDF